MDAAWFKTALDAYRAWREQRAAQRKADMENELLGKRRQADVHNLIERAIILRDSIADLKRQLDELDKRYASGEVSPYNATSRLDDVRTDLQAADGFLSVALARLIKLRELGA